MRNLLLLCFILLASTVGYGQDSSYVAGMKGAISLFDAGQYITAAKAFDEAIARQHLTKGEYYLQSSRAWAAAGQSDSAFNRLYSTFAARSTFPPDRLLADDAFQTLRDDPRWTWFINWRDGIKQPYPQPLFTIPSDGSRHLATDELGNIYLVRADNTVTRFNEAGDSIGYYRNVSSGNIGAIDATNPMRILVYFPKHSRIIVLDRLMAPVVELDLRRINLFSPPAIAYSADGNLWVYDPFNAKLRKVNEQLTEVSTSNDLRQQTSISPTPTFLIERERRLYLCDSANGVLVFDQFATYINTLPLYGRKAIQPIGPSLIYRSGDSLISYNMQNFRERGIPLPTRVGHSILQALVARGRMYVLYDDRMIAFKMPEEIEWK